MSWEAPERLRSNVWNRARLRLVALVGAIVAAAIISVIFAVVTSARRADSVSIAREQQLLTRAVAHLGDKMLHELGSATTSSLALVRIRDQFDVDWIQRRVGLWLTEYFAHDLIFVVDANDQVLYFHSGRDNVDRAWFDTIRAELAPVIGQLRPSAGAAATPFRPKRLQHVQSLNARPAIVAATLVAPPDPPLASAEDFTAPIAVTIKFIDEDVLSAIAGRLDLADLRSLADEALPDGDVSFSLVDENGRAITSLAWTPKRLGREVVESVIPFLTIALGGFVALVTLIARYMRRTTATIVDGENQLRHLALHDALSGLPNRMYFGERLKELFDRVRGGGQPAAAFYLDLDHFKEVNDTLGHPIGDELLRNVAERLGRTLREGDLVARLGGDEFAVLTENAADREAAHAIAMRIINSVCSPYYHHRREHRHRHARRAGRVRRRHQALRRHGALSRQERRPQPRLRL